MPEIINRVHCSDIIENSRFDNSLKFTFAEIIAKDSKGKKFGFSEHILSMKCVDLDAVEQARDAAQLDKTMDLFAGIGTFDSVQRSFSAHKYLLIELKLNCEKHNLCSDDYIGKIKHTRDLLTDHALHPKNIFLFDNNQAYSVARREVAQWCRGTKGRLMKSVLVMNPYDFNNYIGFEHQFPFIPDNSEQEIVESIREVKDDIDRMETTIKLWSDKAIDYRNKCNRLEMEHIKSVVVREVGFIINQWDDETAKLYISISLDGLFL